VLDKSKLPSDLVVDRVWVSEDDSDTRRSIAHVSERRRRTVGALLITVGVMLAFAVLVTRAAFWLAFAPLLIAWAGVAYGGGGRAGFYDVEDDGRFGDYLGPSAPEVGSMRPRKP
jgi:hypothetical protein